MLINGLLGGPLYNVKLPNFQNASRRSLNLRKLMEKAESG